MIREVDQQEIVAHFFDLMGELEAGNHYHPDDPDHVAWLTRRIAVRASQGTRFFVYEIDGGVPAGFIALLFDEGPDGVASGWGKCEILDLGFFPQHRGKGFGSELLKHVEDLAREVGVRSLYVSTYAKENRAIAFYGKNGLTPVATLPDVHGPGDEGMVYMRKVLD